MTTRHDGANGPIAANARLRGLDALRGAALLGILVANIRQMFLPWEVAAFPASLGMTGRLAWIDWFVFHTFIDLKFLTLFSLLFGVGFALQYERSRIGGAGFAGIYLRRVGILAGFGLMHGLLLYPAEVLLPYAIAGFVLLFVRDWSGATLIRGGLFLLCMATIWQYQVVSIRPLLPGVIIVTAVLLAASVTLLWRRSAWTAVLVCVLVVFAAGWTLTSRSVSTGGRSPASEYRDAQQQLIALATDDPSAWPDELRIRREEGVAPLVQLHARQYADILLTFAVVLLWRTLGLFMIGAGLLRAGLFTRPRPALWNRVAIVGLGTGLPLSVLATWLHQQELRGLADWRLPGLLHALSALPLAAGMAGAVFVLHRDRQRHWLWSRLEAAGRMPLTNYVGQSLTMAALAESWGLGWYGRLDAPVLTVVAIGVFVVLASVSRAWLQRFRMGPLEWIWRCGTYWRLAPIRNQR